MKINKAFTSIKDNNVIKAREIFKIRKNIHKIPIINEQEELIGDYSRWEDMLYVERNRKLFMNEKAVKRLLGKYESVYVIEPIENQLSEYIQLIEYLEQFQVEYTMLSKENIGEKLSERSVCICLNEDERRGIQCLYRIELKYDIPTDIQYRMRFATYKSLLAQIICEEELSRLNMSDNIDFFDRGIDYKATILLKALEQSGIKCFCLYRDEDELTEYGRKFKYEVQERLKKYPISLEQGDTAPPKKYENEEFYGELYALEDYENGMAQKSFINGFLSFESKENVTGKYFNAKSGIRKTCFQPEKYIGTIYLLGPCMIVGAYVEDQYTIASCLQKKLIEKGYHYRVENCGSILRADSRIDERLKSIGKYNSNDIVVFLSMKGKAVNIPGSSLEKIFEKNQIPSQWVIDEYLHCNHKANQLVADSILEMTSSCLANRDSEKNVYISIHNIMKEYVRQKYLNQYFSHFDGRKYDTVGAIVMNCNPFTKGHRYLIEQAKKQVEFLIIFAVEENASLFSFEERYRLIMEGTKDINNIMIVPSGEFVLSRNNFREYFSKKETEAASLSAEYDIDVFADYIAEPLHITHRFAGEELEDKVTKIYNDAMAKILPLKGISFIEIPRVSTGCEKISASKVRKYLEEKKYEKAFTLLPESTKQYLLKQIAL